MSKPRCAVLYLATPESWAAWNRRMAPLRRRRVRVTLPVPRAVELARYYGTIMAERQARLASGKYPR
ncbi:hypothetical protein LX15_005387 [Streptoalloteichus tenebrarius]|uniref:Uncharacterized protein n=1 Tax=Streptoalloteichus tenebrarius (strain ATCC 17920 / DSM 40477 / JCM 4838 / CBS 697.72 / NBRC 16177 / NCIMB 11028 / NRRL B-12390 / A12253. 1 / ISP 5477) TaxID=1933 RepID=A0ABT1I1N4_STRSD|nr:hypothetical protein [Streptoalloteichus tenebrarius]MCP2261661.1 hypothetical protein [Streptoalloteichus tenebrarius]BFE99153.1 hypothetical protein GCM10020241_08290 [Streptoalloteichus tenebrarius]